ncbi:PREDICTED: LRR receptor-like serine/threonine-protein kinase GSO2 [Nicotiana attenuata]|uniref:Receptor-like protein 12 n=1 Tax=Nicotiana attenuata TaxID=49451 RepID=A0A1J6IV99_NICAT|nr:PREDICTED: LRR receptor-like serine/threonine-protein kinase GSO2 [Nicotiana attenuata]OIT08742.1 receptor-like protein 12 [Nicotiana attenuata]
MKVLAITFCFFILTNTKFTVCIGFCRENEQQALESLKKEVYDPTNFLSSWIVGKDCCEWEGVVCHNLTRHVIELHIGSRVWHATTSYDLRINNFEWLPSLTNLENLEIISVDLSKATNWLQVINMLPSLVDLRLLHCGLHHIPPLRHHNFSSLETLDLSWNNFSSSIPKWVFNLPSLVSLDLSYSNLIGAFPEGPINFTSLTSFKASFNSFNCLLPRWLFDLNNLEHLELRSSGIEGAMPSEAGNVTKLRNLDLAYNKLNSTIPNWLYRCKDFESLDLGENKIEGVVSNAISNLSSITYIYLSKNMLSGKLPNVIGKLSKLRSLGLSENLFEGEVFELFNSRSNFLPAGLRNSSSLSELYLGNNKLTGTLPESLGLPMLELIDISNNRLKGVVTESHFTNWTQLRYFFASNNNVTLKVSQNWIPPFQAIHIEIGGWNIGPLFPMWLQTQKNIEYLDISNGGIHGEVPNWFWNLPSQNFALDLSQNQFVGKVPTFSTPYWLMLLGSNNFSGPLPQVSPNVMKLDLSNNFFSGGLSHFLCETSKNISYKLEVLNLEGNNLSGEIPDCLMNWPGLEVLILKDNNLIGGIPRSIEVLSNLKSLDIRRNRLTGPLPLANCTKLLKIDLAENEFVGQLPPWLGMKFSDLIILSLSSNRFYGKLPPEICHLKDLQILDLANNSFFGTIPRCISNLTAMVAESKLGEADIEYFGEVAGQHVRESAMVTTKGNIYRYDKTLALVTSMDMSNNNFSGDIPISFTSIVGLIFCNFSKNHLTGRIPNGIGDMKVLESLDLSENQLSGQIPQSLSSLSTLSFLNLSYNNLSGKIPVGTQLQSFNSSSFQGNELCGLPLLANCSSGGQNPNVDTEKDESD